MSRILPLLALLALCAGCGPLPAMLAVEAGALVLDAAAE